MMDIFVLVVPFIRVKIELLCRGGGGADEETISVACSCSQVCLSLSHMARRHFPAQVCAVQSLLLGFP